MMKKIYSLLLALVGFAGFAQATLPFYESFTYADASNLGGQGGWTNVNTGDEVLVAPGSLSYGGLATSTGNHVTLGGGGIDPQLTFVSQGSGMVYSSFIFQVTDLTTLTVADGGYFYGLASTSTNFAATVWLRTSGTGFNIGINKATGIADTQWLPTEYSLNTSYFAVIAYDLGDVKSASIWVNPASASLGGTAPTADANATTGTDRTALTIVFIRQDSATETPTLDIDEVRVGTTWASVTPTSLGVGEGKIAGLKVYPNPVTNGALYITTDNNDTKEVAIFDILGKQVVKASVTDAAVNVSALKTGVYVVKITEAGKTATRKLVVK